MVSKPVYRMGCMWVAVALALPAPVVAQPAAPATADEHAFTDSGDLVAADIFFGGAGAAVVAGVVVLLTAERGGAPRARVAPTPGCAQATFDFRF